MTLVTINARDIAGGTGAVDRVDFWSPVHRAGSTAGSVVHTAVASVMLDDGEGEVELEPGPVSVQLWCQGVADTQPKRCVVPEEGPVTLLSLLEDDMTWEPHVVSEMRQLVERAESAATSASWSGDRLTVLGATSPPLTGEPGPPGDTPTIGENGTWWVNGVDTGVRAQGPAGDGTGDVLWSELNPVLDGKAKTSHTHTPASIGAAPASHTHSQYATTTTVEARTPEIRVVSTIPTSPTPGVVYLRFG